MLGLMSRDVCRTNHYSRTNIVGEISKDIMIAYARTTHKRASALASGYTCPPTVESGNLLNWLLGTSSTCSSLPSDKGRSLDSDVDLCMQKSQGRLTL